jgi:NADPH-dependent ferric siderophore reductase
VPKDLDWHLLVGDASALPAIARRLAELPAGATAIVQMSDVADRRALSSVADVRLQWVSDDAQCLAAVRAWQPPAGEGFAWCAGEAASMAALRRVLVDELGVERHAVRAAAYWKRDAVAYHENLSD